MAGAALRPVQKNGGYPGRHREVGLRLAAQQLDGRGGAAYGQPGIGAMALGVSAIGRHFEVAQFLETPGATVSGTGYGIAANAFIPVIPARTPKGTRHLACSRGRARPAARASAATCTRTSRAGCCPGPAELRWTSSTWTNLPPVYTPNIDSGIVTFDGDRRLRTANWEGFVANLQYYLPIDNGRVWVSGTHSEVWSSNIKEITPLAGWGGIYTHAWWLRSMPHCSSAITGADPGGRLHPAGLRRSSATATRVSALGINIIDAWNWRTEFGMNIPFFSHGAQRSRLVAVPSRRTDG